MMFLKPKKTRVIKMEEIPVAAREILERSFFAYLATAEPKCTPHLTVMFFIWDNRTHSIYLITSKESKKVANIRYNPRVSLTVDQRDPVSPSRNSGVMVRGLATLLEKEEADHQILREYNEKYEELLSGSYPLESNVIIRVQPFTISYWHGVKFYKWKNPEKRTENK